MLQKAVMESNYYVYDCVKINDEEIDSYDDVEIRENKIFLNFSKFNSLVFRDLKT